MPLPADSLRTGRAECDADGLTLVVKLLEVFKLVLLVAFTLDDEFKLFSLTDQRFFDISGDLSLDPLNLLPFGDGSLILDGIPLLNCEQSVTLCLELFLNEFFLTGIPDGSSLVNVFWRCKLPGNSGEVAPADLILLVP